MKNSASSGMNRTNNGTYNLDDINSKQDHRLANMQSEVDNLINQQKNGLQYP